MKRVVVGVLILAAVVLALAQQNQQTQSRQQAGGQLEISVNPQGAALTVTGPNGFVYLADKPGNQTLKNLSPGTYVITATAQGYQMARQQVDVQANQTAQATLKLQQASRAQQQGQSGGAAAPGSGAQSAGAQTGGGRTAGAQTGGAAASGPQTGGAQAAGAGRQQGQEANGQQIFSQAGCAGCHGQNGEGGIGPALAGDQNLKDPQFHINRILNGGGAMPPFKDQLSPEEIAAVATYERTSWGNKFGKVTAQQVKQIAGGSARQQGQTGGAQTGGAQSGGVPQGAQTGGAPTGGAAQQPAGPQRQPSGGAAAVGPQSGGAQSGGPQTGGAGRQVAQPQKPRIAQQTGGAQTGGGQGAQRQQQAGGAAAAGAALGGAALQQAQQSGGAQTGGGQTGGAAAQTGGAPNGGAQQRQQGETANGQQIYSQAGCAGCHGQQGGGGIGPALAGDQNLKDVQAHIDQILHGGGGMPPFANQLSNAEIAAVATYERTSWGNKFGKVTAQQVAQRRQGGAQGAGGQTGGAQGVAQSGGAPAAAQSGGVQRGAQSGGAQQIKLPAPLTGGQVPGAEVQVKQIQAATRQPVTSTPTQSELDSAAQQDDSWLMYNKSYWGQRYSGLSQINRHNVADLRPICALQLGESDVSFESNPIVYDGVAYITTPRNTYAFDAKTCDLLWTYKYSPTGPEPFTTNRGVAIGYGRVYRGTTDAHFLALDAKTGKLLWEVQPVDSALGYFLSSSPVVYNGMVIFGTAGADWGANARIFALDAATGKLVWYFTEIKPDTFGGAQAASVGGGSNWTSFTVDPNTGTLYVPVGNPAPDFACEFRPGDNLYTNSVLALDVNSGQLKYWYQQIPHDCLDRDTAAAPILFRTKDGRRLLAVGSKNGIMYVYNDQQTMQLALQAAGAGQRAQGQTGGSQSAGAQTGGMQTGGARTGGAQSGSVQNGGAQQGAQTAGAQRAQGMQTGGVASGGAQQTQGKQAQQTGGAQTGGAAQDAPPAAQQAQPRPSSSAATGGAQPPAQQAVATQAGGAQTGGAQRAQGQQQGMLLNRQQAEAQPSQTRSQQGAQSGGAQQGLPPQQNKPQQSVGHTLLYAREVTTRVNVDTRPTTQGVYVCPGVNGGVEWYGPAFDPVQQSIYIPSVDWCSTFTLGEVRYSKGQFFFGGSFAFEPIDKAGGWIHAFDAVSGRPLWRYHSERPVVAAVTPTAGGVVFTGELTGDFLALDASSGEVLYRFNTGGPIGGGIATYQLDGTQYVAVASGSASRTWSPNAGASATVFIFALPDDAR